MDKLMRLEIPRETRATDIGRHLISMYGEIIYFKPKIIIELGVRDGISTKILAKAAEKIGAQLISVDKGDCRKSCNWDKWKFIQSDSVEYGNKFDKKADVLFIDTYHSKPQVLSELNAWKKNMNDNCLFIFHDTNPEWPKNKEIARNLGSVLEGVNEFFGFNINNNGTNDYVYFDNKYVYFISHKDYNEGMTYIKRIL